MPPRHRTRERAVRGWQKAGFCPLEERERDGEHLHRWLVMECPAAPARST
jgi:hypothetical protein